MKINETKRLDISFYANTAGDVMISLQFCCLNKKHEEVKLVLTVKYTLHKSLKEAIETTVC